MHDALLDYYERELGYLRELGEEFSRAYPQIAAGLGLQPGKDPDPHVDRLIQAFAFLSARIHRKLDEQFPEITEALLGMVAPHLIRPIPSMGIVQFSLNPGEGPSTTAQLVKPGTMVYSRPVERVECQFQTCYPVSLWPVEVMEAGMQFPESTYGDTTTRSILRLVLQCPSKLTFQKLSMPTLRFYLNGDYPHMASLYELLFNHTTQIQVGGLPKRAESREHRLDPKQTLHPVGLNPEDGLLPYPPHSFLGFRLLQEYFVLPQKYLFFDLKGLDEAFSEFACSSLEIRFLLDTVPDTSKPVSAGMFRLGCTPMVNLFKKIAEPIEVDPTQYEQQVIPDLRRRHAMEIYSIDSVAYSSLEEVKARPVRPLYGVHHAGSDEAPSMFWYAKRQTSGQPGDEGTEMSLTFVDMAGELLRPPDETLMIHTTCTNRDLPLHLHLADQDRDFYVEGGGPRVRCLHKPTPPVRPTLGGDQQWRLVSLLALNHLSLSEGNPEVLKSILRICNVGQSPMVEQQIAGITGLSVQRVVRRPASMSWNGFCRGLEVTVEINEEKFVGSNVFVFGTVLERFVSMYVGVNTFTELVVKTHHGELLTRTLLRQWPARSGTQILL